MESAKREQKLIDRLAKMEKPQFVIREYNDKKRPQLKFVVNYREAEKRKRKFFEVESLAKTWVELRKIQAKNKGSEHVEFSTSLRVMAQECKDALSKHGRTIKEATDFFIAHLKASEKSCTAVQLVKELLAAKKADGLGERHLRDIRCRLGVFAEKFDGQMVATITSKDIDDWLRSIPLGPQTRNHYRALTVLAFNFAVRSGYATTNPAMGAAKAKVVGEAPGILSVNQTARLLEAATPDVLPFVAVGLFAGLRRAELHRLDWREIDFESGLIEVKAAKSKTAQRRFVTMQPNLREWLLPLRQHRGSVTSGEIRFRDAFNQAREAAGITEWPDNALRHSFASYHMAHYKNAADTALQLGHHDSRVTFAHYRELVKPKEAERYWSIKPQHDRKIVSLMAR
jgi:integrase